MSFSPEQTQALQAPLSMANVKRNPRGFDYIEGWHAIAEANRIFGHGEWDRLTEELRQLGEPREVDGKQRIAYFAKVRIIVRGAARGAITRDGCGYGSGIDRDLGQAHESAIKEAETDAMKRALMTFGNPFGLALYDKARANVEQAPPPERSPSNSAYQAKKDGKGERAAALANEIDDLANVSECAGWRTRHEVEVGTWPPSWQRGLWDKLEAHVDELSKIEGNYGEGNGSRESGTVSP